MGRARLYYPRSLLLQWHITDHCNLRCAHCYQESYHGQELDYPDLLGILEQYMELLEVWRGVSRLPIGGHITVTGGEPFMRKDFFDLLEVFAANREIFSFAILTNGGFVDADAARRLKKLGPTYVQVSIDGSEATHNAIRGPESFQEAVKAIRCLVEAGIYTSISFTAHRANYREFPEVARLGRRLMVSRVWSDRLIPSGNSSGLADSVLSPAEVKEFFGIMKGARNKGGPFQFSRITEIAMNRSLQFLVAGGRPYHCLAGDRLITVQPNGDLFPCRRMPIRVGNLLKTPLPELYYTSEHFLSLRSKKNLNRRCRSCRYGKKCRGGLKCLSYALTGDPFGTDPGCWLSNGND